MSENRVVEFKCPDCSNSQIECIMDGHHSCIATEIHTSGDFEYGEYQSQAVCSRWQCMVCGYPLKDIKGELITDNQEVAEWCLENCSQE